MGKYRSLTQKHRERILSALDYFWKNPETGYREWKTNAYLTKAFESLGYSLTQAGDIPGFVCEMDTGIPGPTVAVFGEMDALIVPTHPEADPETGAVHACGHHVQIAALLGLAAVLKEPEALEGLCGKIRLCAVPAEELVELEFRTELRKKGVIRYFGGKPEFMYRGLLDGVDMALMIHSASGEGKTAFMNGGSNGCIVKNIEFRGVSSHAGGSPHLGVNALYAANLALNAANALRETFRDHEHIRFHPIITSGGDSVNAIPDSVKLESYVRGATMEEIVRVNRKINRAVAASAAALGAQVHLTDSPGYWPRSYPEEAFALTLKAGEAVFGSAKVSPSEWGTGCSDMGDVASVMPALHPYVGGCRGTGHGSDYVVADPDRAAVGGTEFLMTYLALLLENGGAEAEKMVKNYRPVFASMQEYFDYTETITLDREAVEYREDGSVLLRFEAK
ncbi:MAG: amidohydrolase [Clostridia bacterium]|nr:amidohydrolase [Clostridia bacterium]